MIASVASTDDLVLALEQRFEKRRQARSTISDQQKPYVLAAAVLHVFDPGTLRPFNDEQRAATSGLSIFDLTVAAVGWRHDGLRSLKPEVRRDALKMLGSREAMRQALETNPDRTMTDLQVVFEQWLSGAAIKIEQLSYAKLEDLRQLYDWRLEDFAPLPDRHDFEAARRRRASVSVFEHLVDENFVGRDAELQKLRDHVGVVSPSTWEKIRSFLMSGPRKPFFIWGPGGSGKTALIGRFLLDHLEAPDRPWFPFAYLPFDSDALDVREPFTILIAAASQLATQVLSSKTIPERATLEEAFGRFRDLVDEYRDHRGSLRRRAQRVSEQRVRIAELSAAEQALAKHFAELLQAIAAVARAQQRAAKVPALLVFDTFEEVLYRTREELSGIWQTLDIVQKHFPDLRLVIASRAQPRSEQTSRYSLDLHKLDDLAEHDAITLIKQLGVRDERAARAIVRQIGGNPLSLRLAARVARDEGENSEGIANLQTRRYYFLNVAPELIRGQLYRRILDHIHEPDVRTLAHPGMVLRRVTPDLIKDVLAPVCGLSAVNGKRAVKLFDQLRQEHTLVSIDDDGSLRYREEVRRPMLELLARDKPTEVKQIHEAAVEHYYSRDSSEPQERAEEIYHRLMLEEGGNILDKRWLRGVERALWSAIEEVPLAQRIWLASRMSIELPQDVYALADLAEWERLYGPKALQALRYEGPEVALSLLRERSERTPQSPLFAIEARILLAVDQIDQAARLTEQALAAYPPMGNPGRLAELLWIRAQALLMLGRPDNAIEVLDTLAEQASVLSSRLPLVQALAELCNVLDRQGYPERARSARDALARAIAALSESEVDSERSLIRLALTRLGDSYQVTASKLIPLVLHHWIYLVEANIIDVRPALEPAGAALAGAPDSRLRELGQRLRYSGQDMAQAHRYLREVADQVVVQSVGKSMDPALIRAVLLLLKTEEATLQGATLAGLEEHKETWETNITSEVAA
jgi:hypothetical protein